VALNFPSSPTIGDIHTDSTSGFSFKWDGVVWKSHTAEVSKSITIGVREGSALSFSLTGSSFNVLSRSGNTTIDLS